MFTTVYVFMVCWVSCGGAEIYLMARYWNRHFDFPMLPVSYVDRNAIGCYLTGPLSLGIGHFFRKCN